MAAARLDGDRYRITAPEAVGQLDSLFTSFREQVGEAPILSGFDFPIGVPAQYARKLGITRFGDALLQFGSGEWADFFSPAEEAHQVSPSRPFYPRAPGGRKKQHLVDGVGLRSTTELLRRCDHATADRTRACELFWTLGANQVGRAAISGWRDLLIPALRNNIIKIWPFEGELADLLSVGGIIVAETYPAEIYSHLGFSRGFGKASREGRRKQASAMLNWCERQRIALEPDLHVRIEDGFGDTQIGEDMFDSIVGLLGMVEVIQDHWTQTVPDDPSVRHVEGWILGMNPNGKPTTPERITGPSVHMPSRVPPIPQPSGSLSNHLFERMCPACNKKLFARWPWGWDAHAANNCTGISGLTTEDRKRVFKERYLRES